MAENHRGMLLFYCLIEIMFFTLYSCIPPIRDVFSTRLFLFVFIAHTLVSYGITRSVNRCKIQLSWMSIIVIYLVTRIAVFPMLPWLSDDVFGYLFYGKELSEGINPYSTAANSASIAYLRDGAYSRMAFPQYPAIYPPYTLYLFGLSSRVGSLFSTEWIYSYFSWKTILFLHELSAVLILLLTRLKDFISNKYMLAYILMPLPAVEIVGQTHCDGLMLPYMALFVLLLCFVINDQFVKKKIQYIPLFFLGVIIGILTAVKLYPIILLSSVFLLRKPSIAWARIASAISGAVIAVTIFSLPLLYDAANVGNFISVLNFYNNTYFNSPPLMFIRKVLELANVQYWWLIAPTMLSIVRVFSVVVILLFARPKNYTETLAASLLTLVAFIFISPKVHVWYVVPLLFMTAFVRWRWLVFMAYGTVVSYMMYGFSEQKEILLLEYAIWIITVAFAVYDMRSGIFFSRAAS